MTNNHLHRQYSIRFTEKESLNLQALLIRYKFHNASKFIKKRIFSEDIHVLTHDESLYKVIELLEEFLFQYKKIGLNYNQVVKHVNRTFGEKKTSALLQSLVKHTIESVQITEQQIVPVVESLKEKYMHDSKN